MNVLAVTLAAVAIACCGLIFTGLALLVEVKRTRRSIRTLLMKRKAEGERAELDSQPIELVAMRLDRMFVTRADQDNSRMCSKCGKPVGIYPSGQRVLIQHPDATIICDVCAGALSISAQPAPGAFEEARDGLRSAWMRDLVTQRDGGTDVVTQGERT